MARRRWRELGWYDRFFVTVVVVFVLILMFLILGVGCNEDGHEGVCQGCTSAAQTVIARSPSTGSR